MKHLPTLLLALGLSAAAATAQNVTVMMKDGTTHKFNADRLSELKFRDVPQEQRMDVTFLEPEISVYSGGNAGLTFKDAEGNIELTADIYGPADAAWLNQGTYTLSADRTPFTIDPQYSSLKIDGEAKTITGAEMYVEFGPQIDASGRLREQGVNPDRIYVISAVITTDDNIRLYGTYVGMLSSYTPWLTLTLDKASYNDNPQMPGDFYVKFSDPDYKCEMAVVFSSDPSATTLPAGTYTLSDVRQSGTISPSSYVDLYRPNANLKLNPGSTIVVTRDGDDYTMEMNLNFNDSRTGEFTFNGAITGTPTFQTSMDEIDATFLEPEISVYSGGNAGLTFKDAEGNIELTADIYGSADAAWLNQGTYTLSSARTPFTIDPAYSSLKINGETKTIVGAEMKVKFGPETDGVPTREQGEDPDRIYTIETVITTDDNIKLTGTYVGMLSSYTPWLTLTLDKASYNDNPQVPGDFYVKFSDPDYKCEMAVVFSADAAATSLPAGTYTLSDERQPGTLSPKSYVDLYRPNANLKLNSGSTIVVTRDGDDYTMEMNLNFNDGRTGEFSFSGVISGTPTFENPQPEGTQFTEVSEHVYSGGNVELTFSTEDGKILVLDMTGSYTATYLEPGVYTVGAETGMFIDSAYSGYQEEHGENVVRKELKSGTATVTEKNGVYTILIDITFTDDTTLNGWFEGELPNYGTLLHGTLTKAEYNDAMARPAGNMYVKFNDPDWIYTVGINFFADPQETRLPAGVYTYGGRGTEPGSFDWNSYVEIYMGGGTTINRMAEGSTVTVEKDEDVYSITMDMKLESGRRVILTYNGAINGAPIFE